LRGTSKDACRISQIAKGYYIAERERSDGGLKICQLENSGRTAAEDLPYFRIGLAEPLAIVPSRRCLIQWRCLASHMQPTRRLSRKRRLRRSDVDLLEGRKD
jgi:hypothetical protein